MNASMIDKSFAFLMVTFLSVSFAILMTMVSAEKQQQSVAGSMVGDLAVEASWASDINADIDLWVQGPKDAEPVGYSRRSDRQCSYLRDDLGQQNDESSLNFEFVSCRGNSPGRYVVNLHLYSARSSPVPIAVKVVIRLTPNNGPPILVGMRSVELLENGYETTIYSFELDNQGQVVPGSVSDVYIPLRTRTTR